ncbi:FK506-binding protein 5-like [Papaver somniferum]|uniref:FK506-binding protein 5-like n=1 Tax=Papaver somniferum TaxID=3469 RepID=UPI000E6FC480|nr:FK506-binding protein 5-like [Papaver somniferum]
MRWVILVRLGKEEEEEEGEGVISCAIVGVISEMTSHPLWGCLFWKTTIEVGGNNSNIEMLLSFDLHNEKIHFIRLPTECSSVCIKGQGQANMDQGGNLDIQIKDLEGLPPGPLCCYFGTTTAATTPSTRLHAQAENIVSLRTFIPEGEIFMELNLRKCESLTIDDEELNNKERLIVTKRTKNDEFEEHEKVVLEIDEEEQVEIVILIKKRKEQIDKERKVIVKITDEIDDEEEQTDKERRVIVRKRKEIDDGEEEEEQNNNERPLGKKRREIDEEEEQKDEKRAVDDDHPPPCQYLPEDLILESILTRLPARTLAICSCVC